MVINNYHNLYAYIGAIITTIVDGFQLHQHPQPQEIETESVTVLRGQAPELVAGSVE